jgi:CheY-like chemotaxis protein
MSEQESGAVRARVDPALGGDAESPLRGRRILVVEDNFLVGTAMCRMLEQLGCVAIGPLARPAEAEAIARGADYDAAVMDVGLAGGNSIEVARAVRARGRPAIFVTGYASNDLLPQELRSEPRLLKPVDPATLRATLLRVLTRGG